MNQNDRSSLKFFVGLKQKCLRSINIEHDLINNSVMDGYILTAQARETLIRVLNPLANNTPNRAWTLTGPYGSGKSFFGLYLMNLLGKSQRAHSQTISQLEKIDPIIANQAKAIVNNNSSNGLLPIPINGFKTSINECFKHGLTLALNRFNGNKKIQEKTEEIQTWQSNTGSRYIVQWINELQEIIAKPEFGYSGILFVFDEMGKTLEHAASNPENGDIFLLQEMAELANRVDNNTILFIGILHQSFERYVSFLDSRTQQEWSKIQGRFEDIPFQEPPVQQIRLISNAIDINNPDPISEIEFSILDYINEIIENNWQPPLIDGKEFIKLSLGSYPLHPFVLIALPYLFRRLAQNERSIFVYLSSHEPFGFQESLEKKRVGEFIRLPEIFDYLSANYQSRLYGSGQGRAITETIEKINHLPFKSDLEIDVIKTIGMITWLTEVSPIQANKKVIINSLRSQTATSEQITEAINNLESRSIIVYRRFNKSFSIWQGSDIDIEERIIEAHNILRDEFSLAEAIQKYMPLRPIIARRHSYQTGTLRAFSIHFKDASSKDQLDINIKNKLDGKVYLFIPSNSFEKQTILDWAQNDPQAFDNDLIIGISDPLIRLRELVSELRCLHWVHDNTPELHGDHVARKELRTRIIAIEKLIRNELDKSFSPYNLSQSKVTIWFHKGERIKPQTQEGLSQIVSFICDKLFSLSPTIRNEILNRNNLSSQGASARRNLIERILYNSDEINLGIEGYPPEISMYSSIIRAGDLHIETSDGNWQFLNPTENNPLNFYSLWKFLEEFIFTDNPKPKSLEALYTTLHNPPFGITHGVLPVLLSIFYKINQGELSLYREGTFLPEPIIADWELLIRRPDLFSISGYHVSGTRQAILERLAIGFHVKPDVTSVVKAIVLGINALPEYTQKTRRLSNEANAVLKAVKNAQSPETLLFVDLPLAAGLEPFGHSLSSNQQIEKFFDLLNSAFGELLQKFPTLLSEKRDEFLLSFGFQQGETGWESFKEKSKVVSQYITNPKLHPIINHAVDNHDSENSLENVLGLVLNRPIRSWNDDDSEKFSNQTLILGKLFISEITQFFPDESLSPDEIAKSREIANVLQSLIENNVDEEKKLIRAALRDLLQEKYTDKIT